MKKYQKLMLASGVATALAGLSMPTHAIIEGAAGEALLVPFVLYSNPDRNPLQLLDPKANFTEPSVNTLVMVTTPSAVGVDTIPNFYTAPNTTPTNVAPVNEQFDPDLGETGDYSAGIHVYFFDERSVEALNFRVPVSPDDMTLINWGNEVENRNQGLEGVKGYMVITNDKPNGQWRQAAKFSMFGDAWVIWPTNIGLIDSKIPVLPMSDGADTTGVTIPTRVNNVIHNSNGGIVAASPLASGMRTNRSNGNGLADYTLFDLTMSNRFLPTLHVIWVDENIGQANTSYVYNDQEQDCSMTLPIANELNVYWTSIPTLFPGQECLIDPISGNPLQFDPPENVCADDKIAAGPAVYPDCFDLTQPGAVPLVFPCRPGVVPELPWVDAALELCYPEGKFQVGLDILNSDIFYPGFVRFQINEYIDNGTGQPESAAVAFSIQLQIDVLDAQRENLIDFRVLPTLLPVETALGHERGQFDNEI